MPAKRNPGQALVMGTVFSFPSRDGGGAVALFVLFAGAAGAGLVAADLGLLAHEGLLLLGLGGGLAVAAAGHRGAAGAGVLRDDAALLVLELGELFLRLRGGLRLRLALEADAEELAGDVGLASLHHLPE